MMSFPLPTALALNDVRSQCKSPPKMTTTFQRRSSRSRSRYCLTYAEWITRALFSSKDRCSCLADIYEWMAFNVPGLQEQRFLHSSKGWKNAVRHTLSINPRFRKMKRFGKPSLWTLTDEYLQQSEALSKLGNPTSPIESNVSQPFEAPPNVICPSEHVDMRTMDWISNFGQHDGQYPFEKLAQLRTSKEHQEYQRILASFASSHQSRPSTQILQVTTLNGSEATFLLPRPLPIRCLTDEKLFLASLIWPASAITNH